MIVSFDNSFDQETLAVTAHDALVFEFMLTTDQNIDLDLQNIELKLGATLEKELMGISIWRLRWLEETL